MNRLEFRTDAGETLDPNLVMFPLFTEGRGRRFRLLGTGFFVVKPGGFVTAKHCFFRDDRFQERYDWVTALMAHGCMRRVATVAHHEKADISFAYLDSCEDRCSRCSENRVLRLSDRPPFAGERFTYFGCNGTAFEECDLDDEFVELRGTIGVRGYQGRFDEVNDGNPFAPWQHYFCDGAFPSGASGGPAVNSSGHVVGVNSSSAEGSTSAPSYARVTSLRELLDGTLSTPVSLNGDPAKRVTLRDIIVASGGRVA